jgi:large subunit ribosomal protein L21
MKYAIVQFNGKQYKVAEGDILSVDSSTTDSTINFDQVLVLGGDSVQIGTPFVTGAVVKATVLGEVKGPKIRVAKFKAKSNYHRATGHRSHYKQIRIDSI